MSSQQLIVLLFGCLYFLFIFYSRRKGDFEDFSVAGRKLGVFLIFASLSASIIGPFMTMGLSREGYNTGFLLSGIATLNGVVLFFVAFFIAPKIRKKFTDSYSIGDVIGGPKSHNHPIIRLASGVISFWMMASICIAMSYAGGELINNVFGFPKRLSIVIISSIVMAYSFFGGIRASIQTDAFQFICFLILIPVLGLSMIFSEGFSFPALANSISTSTAAAYDAQTATGLLGLILFWVLSAGFDSMYINRYLASKNEGVSRKATFLTGIFIIGWILLMLFIGSTGKLLHPALDPNSDQLLLHIAAFHYSGAIYGIFIIAMLGVVMSTQDSTLNSAAVSLSEDILLTIKPDITQTQKLHYARWSTIGIGLLSIFIAAYIDSILETIMIIFSIYAPMMIPVILFSTFLKRHYWPAALGSMFAGLFGYFIWEFMALASAFPTILFALMASSLSYLGIHKLSTMKIRQDKI